MFENWLGVPKERGLQFFIRDDGGFIFRQLDIEDSFLVEKDSHHSVIKAWLMFYKLLKNFNGYKNIPAGMVTLSFGRDIILDPFNQLKDGEKPSKGKTLIKSFVSKIAEARCYKHEQAPQSSYIFNKATVSLGIVMVLLAVVIGVVAVW